MYKIFADDTLIYDSTLEDYKIVKGSISLETNKSGSFTFSIYPDHFYYNNFVKLKTVITVYKSGKIIFRGRILNDTTDYWNNKVITCEGELGFLQDSIIRPFRLIGRLPDLLKIWIDDHNEQVDDFKRFKIGSVTVLDPKGYTECENGEYSSTLETLTTQLTGKLNGYLYITHGKDGTDPIPTLNYLADFEKVSSQKIEFGSNLKNYAKTVKAENIATAIIPLGAEIDDEDSETNDPKLTISSVNDGLDYVYSATGVAIYGWIFKVVSWNDVTSAVELKRKAEEYLNEILGEQNTIELNAVDLHLLDPTIESINVGEYVRVVSTPHNVDMSLLCSGQTIDLLKPENDSFTLGSTYTTISQLNNDLIKNITSNYVTNKRFTREFSHTSSLIEQTEERIKLEVDSLYVTQNEIETVEERLMSQIEVEKGKILLEVDSLYVTQNEIETVEERLMSQIEVEKGEILLNVSGTYTTKTAFNSYQDEVSAELGLKIGRDENNQIVSMLNASADVITLNSNRLIINSDNLKLEADGTLTATALAMNGGTVDLAMNGGYRVVMGLGWNDFGVCTSNYNGTYGTRLGLQPNMIVFEDGGVGTVPILFDMNGHKLIGEWYVGNLGSSTPVTSDETKKNTIEPQADVYSRIFDRLNPVTFKYNNGTSDRIHTGLIAQEVEKAVIAEGLTTRDFGAVCYDVDDQGNKTRYGVRYEELVSMCIYEIQRLKKVIAAMEK